MNGEQIDEIEKEDSSIELPFFNTLEEAYNHGLEAGRREIGKYCMVPTDVLIDPRFSSTERILYAIINGLCRIGGKCWASNKYLSKYCGCTERQVRYMLDNLRSHGMISCVEEIKGDKTSRIIRTLKG